MDKRVEWLKDRACLGLGLTDEQFESFLKSDNEYGSLQLLDAQGNPIPPTGLVSDRLRDFFNNNIDEECLLLFKKTQEVEVVETIEESSSSEDEAEVPSSENPDETQAEDGEGEGKQEGESKPDGDAGEEQKGEDDGEKKAEEGEVKDGEGDEAKGEEDEGDEEVPKAPVKAPKPPKTRTVTQIVEVVEVFLCLSKYPDNVAEIKSMYFVRQPDQAVEIPEKYESEEDINIFMSENIDYGVLTGHSLVMMHQSLVEVYLPLLSPQLAQAERQPNYRDPQQQQTASVETNEFLGSVSKFASQVSHVVNQVKGEIRLSIPDIVIEDGAVDDPDVIAVLDEAVVGWTESMAALLEQQLLRTPTQPGPLAEIDFWRDRSAALSTMYEQLNLPHVKQMRDIVEQSRLASPQAIGEFNGQMQELNKFYKEAKDNVKFLSTLERHFKIISSGNLLAVQDTLPSMMNALRMVWIISRHYNNDSRMVPLMERIANEIALQVAKVIDVKRILSTNPEEAMSTITEAKNVLVKWRDTYFQVREKIEQSGRDARWEFDRRVLFEKTDYMASRCSDLLAISQVMDHFHKFLGPELRAVTGDSQGIDEIVKRVENLVSQVRSVSFDIFDKHHQTSWETMMHNFNEDVIEIEEQTKQFINKSFAHLRSAEGAFELLQNFKNIKSRPAINDKMMEKFTDILVQYGREVDNVRELFESNMENPPIMKNQPPIAGSITWARSLYHRIKRTILKFQTMEDLLQTDEGRAVSKKYVSVAKAMWQYENKLFGEWKDFVFTTAMNHLKVPILEERKNDGVTSIEVNFHVELTKIIRETKYLDRMGFSMPETALNITLQEDKYHSYVEQLHNLLDTYNNALGLLNPVESDLLSKQRKVLRKQFSPGFQILNWNSLGIENFIVKSHKALNEFQSVVNQVQKNSQIIDSVCESIRSTNLTYDTRKDDKERGDLQDIQDFAVVLKNRVSSTVNDLVRKYHTIGPLLGKIEEVVAGTNTLKSPVLKNYYAYWERKIFNALNYMIVTGLLTFHEMLGMNKSRRSKLGSKAYPPLFKLAASLSAPEIVVSPSLGDVEKTLMKQLKNILEASKPFVRWMRNTCIECPEVRVTKDEDEEPTVYSFFSDIISNPQVTSSVSAVSNGVKKVIKKVQVYIESWRKYDSLWKLDKSSSLEKFSQKKPSCGAYDSKLSLYNRLAQDIDSLPLDKDIEFVRVSCLSLEESIKAEALAWVATIGTHLNQSAREKLTALQKKIDDIRADLHKSPDTLDSLKEVLNTIANIHSRSMEMELEYLDIQERYRTLAMYNCAVPDEEKVAAAEIGNKWVELCEEADSVDVELTEVKTHFQDVTKSQTQDFLKVVEDLRVKFDSTGPGVGGIGLDEGLEMMDSFKFELATLSQTRFNLTLAEKLFNLPITPYPGMSHIEREIKMLDNIYSIYADAKESQNQWANMLWSELDINTLTVGTDEYLVKLKKLPKDLRALSIHGTVEDALHSFKDSLPLMVSLKSEGLRDRHWKKLMDVTGKSFHIDPKTFTLQNLFAMELHKFQETIDEIVSGAQKELAIEKGIEEVAHTWKSQKLGVKKYFKGTEDRGFILMSTDDINMALEDNTMNLQSMTASKFVIPFLEQVQKWEKALSLMSEVVEVWMRVQSKWMYLESIFIGSDDIRLQLPEEAKRFDRIDKAWKKIMSDTAKTLNVFECCKVDGRLGALQGLLNDLETTQKSLSDYLETKRNAFARFYFISDDELLSILGSSDPSAVQEHLLKMFENCARLNFGKNGKNIVGMESSEKEAYSFSQPVVAEGPVETWMTKMEAEMRVTLHDIMKKGVFHAGRKDRMEWIEENLGMVGLTGSQIWWTWECEDVFRRVRLGNKHAMKQFSAKCNEMLGGLVREVRGDLSNITRKKINTLVILDVHSRDIIDSFVRDSILDAKEFAWESQLRFYWQKGEDDIAIQQCTFAGKYGYEYQGLNGRLVITPLTDRCFMTLTQALAFRLGGSPAGPAGTGKTESVKDLAKAMGILCVVFNCGEGLDYKAMGSNFSGLVQCGAWGCFDEFNRIDAEVLSVVSAQIKQIQNALAQGFTRFVFEGREIGLDARCGIFITMNPGYAGRTELPDNLKALFRPVVMVVPDLVIICENMLLSEGFDSAKVLAKKMTVLYKLAKEQLSKQHHYDFGLRALKSVLVMAGALKRGSQDLSEDMVLMRALRDMNLPKFVFDDVPLFKGLINDLFPGLDCPRVRYAALNDAIEDILKADGYELLSDQADKVVQLYETMLTRHTTMVVGPTCGGKTVVIKTLAQAQGRLNLPTKLFVVNPKAITVSELYGVLDPVTRDWTDGLLSNIMREINKPLPEGKDERRYILFDGDVDAVWVENMNSVMDDNKLLTLPNGERIRLQNHCKMLFEVFDLQYASPATISRCGMVYVDPKNLGVKPYIYKWVNGRSDSEAEVLGTLFDKYVHSLLDFVLEGMLDGEITTKCTQIIPLSNLNMVKQLCAMLTSLLTEDKGLIDPAAIEAVFVFCLVWSIGGTLVEESRERFDKVLKRVAGLNVMDNPNIPAGPGQLPGAATLYEWFFDDTIFKWQQWKALVTDYVPPPDRKFAKIVVPTVDTVRSTWLLDCVAAIRLPCLFVGESGTAKTVTIQAYLSSLPKDENSMLEINFSSRTSSQDVQRNLEDNVEKRTKDTYGPPPGRRLIVFVDDLNMPRVDTYGTQQPIALLKLLIDRGGLYDRGKELNWKNMKDIQFVAAMAPPGGGRNNVDPRFITLFNVFNITFPAEESLKRIYENILNAHTQNFDEDIAACAVKLTEMTLDLYQATVAKLPPTPSKFHYIFNLRDLGRIYEGLLTSTPDKFEGIDAFVRLWRNECLRVFHDRLISSDDKAWMCDKVETLVKENFPEGQEEILADPIIFGDYLGITDEENESEPRLYESINGYAPAAGIFGEILETYNAENKPFMNLVLFDDAVEHVTRIHRIIRMDRGNALLVGVGGSGKQSLTRLAAFAAGCSVFQIQLARGYGEAEFREDLKTLYEMIGVKGEKVAFLFLDQHVVDEGFLELINNMLTTGMVPALFAEDEKDRIIGNIRDEVVKAGVVDTKENCWQFYVNKCRDNLHVILAMSPVGDALRLRCRNFPGLVNNTTIDWFTPWPDQALTSVAQVFLKEEVLPEKMRSSIIDHMVYVHNTVRTASAEFEVQLRRSNYVTPKNYLDFISNYRSQLKDNRQLIGDQSARLEGGLNKLVQAADEVSIMKTNLAEQKKLVDAKTQEVNALLDVISKNTKIVEEKQAAAAKKESDLTTESARISIEKAEAEKALEEAIPALEAAAKALENLSKNDITEIRSFAKPHLLVQAVCECVVILKGLKDITWKGAKAMMADSGFLNSLLTFDKDGLSDRQINRVKEYLKNPKFTIPELKNISTAGAGLLNWVLAIVNYFGVAKTVNPKRQAVASAEKSLRIATKDLEKTKAEVDSLNQQLKKLSDEFEKANQEAQDLKTKADLMEKRLDAAERLISGLGSERERWSTDIEELQSRKTQLVGDCLLTSGFLSYTGAFTFEYRRDLIYNLWLNSAQDKELSLSPEFRLETLLADEVTLSLWASQGLPSDELSIQNGVLTTKASRYPLCIDPQLQAVNWVKQREGKNQLKVCTFNDGDFIKQLELAVTYGFPFLFENVDEYVDPVIDNVLEKNFNILGGNRKTVRLGDKDIDWDENFRLYMTSKLANPHYSPEISGKTMIINYSVTLSGLEDQLLNVIVQHERSDLEEQRQSLISEMSENKSLLKTLEDTLLRELANSQGNILDNEELISTLESAKLKAVEIGEKLELAKKTAADIDDVRNGYRPGAKRGSILFFAMSSLSLISSMYEFALGAYLGVFSNSLGRSAADPILETRLNNIIAKLTMDVYQYTTTGLFEKHKLMFSFQMTMKILEGEDRVNQNELNFLLKGNTSLESGSIPKPCEWMTDSGWKDLIYLQEVVPACENICHDVAENEGLWKAWYDLETPEKTPIPMGYEEQLDKFQRMCVLRCFRMDRMYVGITLYVMSEMGEEYVQPPVLNYPNIFQQSSPFSPIVFILSPGADPASDVFKLADKLGMGGNKFKFMALGQGQGPIAQNMLETGSTRGNWVMLQNCHLLQSWLKTLEKILEKIEKPHKDFRLWLTTEPIPTFPLGILQKAYKVVTEPPNGLKLNMRNSYSRITEEMLDECPHTKFRPLVYVLGFFHAVVQDRRKYGKIGWNVPYDFNDSDFNISFQLLSTYLGKASEDGTLPWGSLQYLIGEAMYGGRVTDAYDRRILNTYLDEYMGDFLFDKFQPFHFFDGDFDYRIPEYGSKDAYTGMIETLPLVNSPEVFGLHPNAEMNYYSSAAKRIQTDLVSLQPRTSGGSGGTTREEHIAKVATDIQGRLPQNFDLNLIKKNLPQPVPPTTTVLLQELEIFNRLNSKLFTSLVDLQRALIGEIGMSSELDELATCLYNGQLPAMWRKLSPQTEKPLGSWINHFGKRYEQYRHWVEVGEPVVLWLAGLHIPETYLAAIVQTACRVRQWPLDKSTLYTEVTKSTDPADFKIKPETGCYLSGLYLEGAGWDLENRKLARQKPKVLVVDLPIIQVIPIEVQKLKLQNTIKTPVYVNQGRRNAMGVGLVLEADLKTDMHPSHWVLQGVCLVLNTDE